MRTQRKSNRFTTIGAAIATVALMIGGVSLMRRGASSSPAGAERPRVHAPLVAAPRPVTLPTEPGDPAEVVTEEASPPTEEAFQVSAKDRARQAEFLRAADELRVRGPRMTDEEFETSRAALKAKMLEERGQ
jgi:hypothetical protein